MSSDAIIQVSDVVKSYHVFQKPSDRLKQMIWGTLSGRFYGREFRALDGVSFQVQRGSMLGIIGRNGSGKSTLLQCLAGTLSPTSGEVKVHGRVAALLELGSGFNPEFTGRENVYLYGTILGIGRGEMDHRFEAIERFAGIGEFIDQPIKTYSSGMTVRLAFSVASSVDAEVLIIDEALAVGDLGFQAKCFRRFREIRERGTTVLLVTHDMSGVTQFCSDAAILVKGKLAGWGKPKEMVDQYKEMLAAEIDSGGRAVGDVAVLAADAGGQKETTHPEMAADCPCSVRHPNCDEYGDGSVTIESFAVLGGNGRVTTALMGGEGCTVVMRLRFVEACDAPIAAFKLRDIRGNEVAGTNTWYENAEIGRCEAGDRVEVRFAFVPRFREGAYMLCLSCTELVDDGVSVHHRLYDVNLLECVTTRRFVGVFDLEPQVKVVRMGNRAAG